MDNSDSAIDEEVIMSMPLLKSRVICIYQNGDLNIASIMILHLSSFLYHSFFITV